MEKLTKFNVRLNSKKCLFVVSSYKLLEYVVSSRGIEIDLDKIKAIKEMSVQRWMKYLYTEIEIRSFLGHLLYINRFISKMSSICEPIFRLLRKDQPTVWK